MNSGIVLLTVEDGGVGYRTGDSCLPVCRIGAENLFASVRIGQFKHTAECTFLSDHSIVSGRGDDFVGPPSRSDLCRQYVLCIGTGVEGVGYVVGERQFGLVVMGETGFQYLIPDQLTVDIYVINSEG